MATETEFAPAKVNLCLHVTGQRGDGYHLLDSLVVFANVGDTLAVTASDELTLAIDGPMADALPVDGDNLVLRAARFLNPDGKADIRLTKRLPMAAGLGGGSADAAAVLRALARLWRMPLPNTQETAALGADVPVCMTARAQRLRGVGERLDSVPPLPAMDVLLVNPRQPVPTPAVFRALKQRNGTALAETLPSWRDPLDFCDWLAGQRNDLLAPALTVAPVISDVLALIRQTDCLFAGMSGSGATCFGLYLPDGHSAKAARAHLYVERPDWWGANGSLS